MEKLAGGLFANMTASDFPFERDTVIEISTENTLNEAFKTLYENNILSAPIYDDKAKKYLGFFDIIDALAIVYGVDLILETIPEYVIKKSSKKVIDFTNDQAGRTIGEFYMDGDSEAPWRPVEPSTPMKEIVSLLADSVRRVPVIDPETKRVEKIISQSQVTKVLHDKLEEMKKAGQALDEVFTMTPENNAFGVKNVVVIEDGKTVRDAFKKILNEEVSCVGVLDSDRKLFTCISTKDIRLFGSIESVAISKIKQMQGSPAKQKKNRLLHPALFDMSAADFVSFARQLATGVEMTRPPVVKVSLSTPIEVMIGKLSVTKMHRVFLIDADNNPIGIVSVADICKLLNKA